MAASYYKWVLDALLSVNDDCFIMFLRSDWCMRVLGLVNDGSMVNVCCVMCDLWYADDAASGGRHECVEAGSWWRADGRELPESVTNIRRARASSSATHSRTATTTKSIATMSLTMTSIGTRSSPHLTQLFLTFISSSFFYYIFLQIFSNHLIMSSKF